MSQQPPPSPPSPPLDDPPGYGGYAGYAGYAGYGGPVPPYPGMPYPGMPYPGAPYPAMPPYPGVPYPGVPYAGMPPAPPRRRRAWIGWVIFIVLALVLLLLVQKSAKGPPAHQVALSEFVEHLQAGEVSRVTIEGDEISGEFPAPRTLPAAPEPVRAFRTELPQGTAGSWAFMSWLLENRGKAKVEVRPDSNFVAQFVLPLVPWLLIFGFIWFFVFRVLRKTGAVGRPTYALHPADPSGRPGPLEVVIVNRDNRQPAPGPPAGPDQQPPQSSGPA